MARKPNPKRKGGKSEIIKSSLAFYLQKVGRIFLITIKLTYVIVQFRWKWSINVVLGSIKSSRGIKRILLVSIAVESSIAGSALANNKPSAKYSKLEDQARSCARTIVAMTYRNTAKVPLLKATYQLEFPFRLRF